MRIYTKTRVQISCTLTVVQSGRKQVCFCCDGVSFELSLMGTCVEDVNGSFLNDLHVHYICQLYTMRHKFSNFNLIFKMQIGMKMK